MSVLMNFSSLIGFNKFLRNEVIFRKNNLTNVPNKSKIFLLIKHFRENVLNSEENYKAKNLEKKVKAKNKENQIFPFKKEEKQKLHTHIFFTDDGKILTEDEYKDSIANII
jgi:protocatechuate 3,4-dioxygenase beta subunit